jgi:hypothetical protein
MPTTILLYAPAYRGWLSEGSMVFVDDNRVATTSWLPLTILPPFAVVVGLRHAMWFPKKAGVQSLAAGTHGKGKSEVRQGQRQTDER